MKNLGDSEESLCVPSDSSFHKCPRSSPVELQCSPNRKLHTVRFGSEKGLFVFWARRSRTHGEYFLTQRVRPVGAPRGAQLPPEPRQVDGAEGGGAWEASEWVRALLLMGGGSSGGEGVG